MYDEIAKEIRELNKAGKYEPLIDKIYLYRRSLYIMSKRLIVEVDLRNTASAVFEKIVSMPLSANFEESDNVSDSEQKMFLEAIAPLNRYCSTLIFINKHTLKSLMEKEYTSHLKASKVNASISIASDVSINLSPIKASRSIDKQQANLQINLTGRPLVRSDNGVITVNALPLKLVLESLLLSETAKLEIDRDSRFLRLSCFHNDLRVKFSILNHETFNF